MANGESDSGQKNLKTSKKLLTSAAKSAIINTESEVRETSEPRRKLSKAELVQVLTNKVEKWIADGIPPEEAIGKLTEKQYDFLIDQNVDLDKYLLSEEQLKTAHEVRRAQRTCKPGGYNKKYPQSKQDLFNGLCEYIQSQGATIQPREKQNYRDLDFVIGDTHYRIVLSNPRS